MSKWERRYFYERLKVPDGKQFRCPICHRALRTTVDPGNEPIQEERIIYMNPKKTQPSTHLICSKEECRAILVIVGYEFP